MTLKLNKWFTEIIMILFVMNLPRLYKEKQHNYVELINTIKLAYDKF